ncbi:MAG: hypothetical protein ABI281_02320 [Caldimonas sp.]
MLAFIAMPRHAAPAAEHASPADASQSVADLPAETRAAVLGESSDIAQETAADSESDEARRRAGEVEVCGVGLVRPETLESGRDAPWAAAAASAVERLVARMQGEAGEQARVTALMLKGAADAASALTAEALAVRHRCGSVKPCIDDAALSRPRTRSQAMGPSTEAIAKLASSTQDPYVYATAVEACRSNRVSGADAPSCQLVSVEQWTRIDPTNAVPWLHLAGEARSRKDAAGVDEAMYRVATATTSRVDGARLYGEAMSRLTAEASEFEKAQVAGFVLAIVAEWQLPAYQVAVQWCAAPLLQDSNRWQACDGAAQTLMTHPSTLLERRIALRIGERARWPAERIARLREEDDALAAAQSDLFSSPDPLGCGAVMRTHAFWTLAAAAGEVEAARALAKASGKSMQTLAGETRMSRETFARAAASAPATPESAAPSPAR